MFESIFGYDNKAIALLVKDHETVKDLFEQYQNSDSRREKMRIAAQTLEELSIHAIIEEEVFYPAVRKQLEKDIMNEADEEHHIARFLVAELSGMDGSEDHYDAKYKVLAENVRHHIKEEERDMLPKAKALDLDFDQLASLMRNRKEELKRTGLPVSLEERMVQKTRDNDTPAREASRTAPRQSAPKRVIKHKAHAQQTKINTGNAKKSASRTTSRPAKSKLKIVSQRTATASKTNRKSASSAKAKEKNRR